MALTFTMISKFRSFTLFFFALSLADGLCAAWYDPFGWFTSREEEILNLRPATLEEEQEAARLYEDGLAALEVGKEGRAKGLFEKIADDYQRTIPAPDALMQIARIHMSRSKWHEAFEMTRITLIRYPDYEGFNDIVATQFEIATSLMDGARGRIFGIIPTFKSTRKARDYFEGVLRNGPFTEHAPLALMNIAKISVERDEPEFAIDALDRLINIYPDSTLAADAYLELARTYASLVDGTAYDQGATREAISYYEDFLILFPASSLVPEAEAGLSYMREIFAASKYNTGDFYFRFRKNTTAALAFYNEAITVGPNTHAANLARERIESIEAGARPPRFDMGMDSVWQNIRGGDGLPGSVE